ncbi:MAG: nucleoside phosphorylase [Streptococcaceae bacterium]|jgi:uridine phosphorylase|nr:nucleoside phosphorylase [Streptococcaceae bacterium]
MTIYKNKLPILEYDTSPESIIKPERDGYHFPEKAVFAFLGDRVDTYALAHDAEIITTYETSTTFFHVYKIQYEGEEITLVRAPVGAAPAAQVLEFMIGSGVRKIISIGACGALVDLPENQFFIAEEALRDEGTSYHYLPAARTIKFNSAVISKIEAMFQEQGFAAERCKSWTTDAFYRETKEMVLYRVSEGCQVVEMEGSALAAVAEFRMVQFGLILFTADTLAASEYYDERTWGSDAKEISLNLAFAAVSKL